RAKAWYRPGSCRRHQRADCLSSCGTSAVVRSSSMGISSGNGFASMLAPFGGGTSYPGTPRRGRHTYAVGGKIPPKGGTGLGGTEEVVRPRVAFQTDLLRGCYTPGRPPGVH